MFYCIHQIGPSHLKRFPVRISDSLVVRVSPIRAHRTIHGWNVGRCEWRRVIFSCWSVGALGQVARCWQPVGIAEAGAR